MEPAERVASDSPTDSAADSPTRSLSESTSNAEMALADGVIREVISTLGKLEDEAQTEAVREGIAVQRRQLKGLLKEQLKENMKRRWRKVVTGDEAKRVRDHIREPIVARSIDKFSFTFGVLNLAISEFILVKHPSHFWIWYMIVIPALVCFRIWHYTSNKWQYFLMDFCYYTQILCIAQLFFFQRNCALFKANFMLSNGPLAWAVPVWRNSLVFHDVEKVTSLFIHVFPGLLLYTLKWYPSVTTTGSWSAHESCGPITWQDVVLASVLYIAWQMMYYLKVEVLEKAKLDADPDLQTSLRWLAKDRKNMLHKLVLRITRSVGILAPDEVFDHRAVKTKIIFILTQFVYTMVTTTPAILIYQNFYLHVAYGIILFVVAVFNGAAYYIEVFSVRYVNKYPRERPAGLGVGFVAQRTAQGVAATAAGLPPELKRSMSDGHCTVLQAEHITAVALDDKKSA